MSYQLTADDIRASLIAEGINPPVKQKGSNNLFNKAVDMADKFNTAFESTGIPNLGAGFLAAPLHLAQNVANAPGALSNAVLGTNIPKMELPQWADPTNYVESNTPTQRAMGMAGEFAGDLLGGGLAYKAANKALGIGAKAPLIARASVGAGTGAALSDSDQFGGRGLGAAIGGALPIASGLTAGTIGKKAAQISTENTDKYSALYNKIISEAEKSGASKAMQVPQSLRKPNEDVKKFFKHTDSQLNASVQRYMNNPTFENAHKAQSDLGKIVRKLERQSKEGIQLSSGQADSIPIAKNLQKRIRGSMAQSLNKSNRNDLAKSYSEATRGYAKEVGPLKLPEIAKYKSGKIPAGKAGEALLRSSDFAESSLAKQLPGYQARKMIHDLPNWVKVAAGTAAIPTALSLGVPVPYYLRKLLNQD